MSALMILAALLLDFVLGDPAWGWHPVRVLGHITAGLEICCRGLPMEERAKGVVFLLLNLIVFMFPLGIIFLIA